MIGEFNDDSDFAPETPYLNEIDTLADVPHYLDILPDDTEALVFGDVERFREFNHQQGENDLGYEGTCGLVSCEDILQQFGIDVNENEVVTFAAANGLCEISFLPEESGGTTEYSQAELLTDLGVPAHAEFGDTQEQLAQYIEEGRSVLVEVNAGELWDSPADVGFGEPNHVVVVTGVARDPDSGGIEGFYINDSGRGYPSDSGRFVDSDVIHNAWEVPGGSCVITDISRSVPA
jgi:hypothetical protein